VLAPVRQWRLFRLAARTAKKRGAASSACDPVKHVGRKYRRNTLILETEVETGSGAVTLVEFMPPRGKASDLVRLVVGKRGEVTMRTELTIRFDYGSLVPWVTHDRDGTLAPLFFPLRLSQEEKRCRDENIDANEQHALEPCGLPIAGNCVHNEGGAGDGKQVEGIGKY
jgi:hypothetical protein